ncbi:hypothetical protein V499_04349 [Pseudogymnoascus sp. VKM F-103]|nr:hypothetical protein V499_04349 [Pseudogymnoascus sp. VKM F-103]
MGQITHIYFPPQASIFCYVKRPLQKPAMSSTCLLFVPTRALSWAVWLADLSVLLSSNPQLRRNWSWSRTRRDVPSHLNHEGSALGSGGLAIYKGFQRHRHFEAYARHAKFVTAPGIFPVVSASIGEAAHLDSQERIKLIQTLRLALDDIGLYKTPIVAGVGAHSTRQTTQLAHDAAAAGADFVLVVPPGYYAGVLKTNPTAIRKFFIDVAAASPVPVIIYNFPAVSAGIDLSSDDVVEIAKAAPNICGIMLSCGNVGKLARITALVDDSSFKTLAGFIDFLLPSVAVGSAGAISPLPNIAPNFSSKLWQVAQSLGSGVDFQEAKELQGKASLGETALLKEGLPGLKGLLNQQFGYPAAPRLPLMVVSNDAVTKMSANKHLQDVMAQEKILETMNER